MSQITRQSFIDAMSSGSAPGIDPNGLAPATQQALEAAGIAAGSLGEIAGADARISGHEELSRLFDLIDRVDRNGSTRSIATTARGDDGRLVATLSGAAAEALKDDIAKARINRGVPAPARQSPDARYERSISTLQAAGMTDIHLAKGTPYYNQGDPQWRDYPYPKSPPEPASTRTLQEAGCAPCALAMADATLRGSKTTPSGVADFAINGGFSGAPGGYGSDTVGLTKAWATANDLTFTLVRSGSKADRVTAIRAGLDAGGVALVSVGAGHFTKGSHVMLVNGYARDVEGQEWFFIANPGRKVQREVDDAVKQEVSLDPAFGGVRISRAQLETELGYACVLERRG